VIIDDNSDPNYVTERVLYKTDIIQSEFPGRGELLPYYYYARHNWFPTAVVLHDGVFINKHINFNVDKYKIIWEFNHYWDKPKNEIRLIKALKNHDDLLELHADKSAWKGCFGAMSVITHEFVKMLDDKYDLARLLPLITTRKNRQTFERVFACLLQANHKKEVLMGFVLKTTKWGYPFYKYIKEYKNEKKEKEKEKEKIIEKVKYKEKEKNNDKKEKKNKKERKDKRSRSRTRERDRNHHRHRSRSRSHHKDHKDRSRKHKS
jgi:hypothetical protein